MRKYFKSMILILILSFLNSSIVFGSSTTSGEIDYVLIDVNNETVVKVISTDYIDMYIEKNGEKYNFLKGNNTSLAVYGIVSGEKYIMANEFIDAYIESGNKIVAGIELANQIGLATIGTFKQIAVDNKGNIIKNPDGTIKLEPITPPVQEFKVLNIY